MRVLLLGLAFGVALAACATSEGEGPVGRETPVPTESAGAPSDPSPTTAAPVDPTTATESPGTDGRDPGAGVWSRHADAPMPLTEVAAAPFGGSVWTAGGLGPDGEATTSVLVYDPTFDTWESGPPLPAPIHHAAMVTAGTQLHVIGGYAGSGFDTPTDAVHVLDLERGEWVPGAALPAPRAAGAAAWDGERILYAGGVGPAGLSGEVLASAGSGWERIGELSEPREHLAAASDGRGRVWFLGGRTGGFDTNLAAVDLVSGGGVARVGDLPTPRGGVAGIHLPGAGGCAVGGEGAQGTFAEVECVDAGGVVTVLAPLAHPRHGLGAVLVEDVAYAVLGGPQPGLFASPVVESLSAAGAVR